MLKGNLIDALSLLLGAVRSTPSLVILRVFAPSWWIGPGFYHEGAKNRQVTVIENSGI